MDSRALPLIVAAPDSFKGSCSAEEAAEAMLRGARQVFGERAEYRSAPLADGGEGTLDALLAVWGTPERSVEVRDALGRPRRGRYALSVDGRTALIESAEANGLPWVADVALRPLDADTRGVGALVSAALRDGAEELLLCLGGSATSDGGTGLLSALGARFLDADGEPVAPGAAGLARITSVDASGIDPAARAARWRIALDVDNPLVGARGAAEVFGPQKGASPEDVRVIDAGLGQLARVLAAHRGIEPEAYLDRPGFGAAGGIALACVALLDAETLPGGELVSAAVGLPDILRDAALVLTGEGQLDSQSLGGKVVDLVLGTAPAGVPVAVIAGSVRLSAAECRAAGIAHARSLATGPDPLEELLRTAEIRIEDAAAQVCQALATPAPIPFPAVSAPDAS